MPVIWLIQVQDAMQESLRSADPGQTALDALLASAANLLQATFPKAENIVVVDRLGGYSSARDKHALRVEVVEQGVSHARIVKIGPPEALAREWAGWVSCERPSNDRGCVFMTLQPGKRADDGSAAVETLIYEDARQTLRAAELISLEQAVLQCCQWGTPSAASLLVTFDLVFAELVNRLYRRSWSRAADDDVCRSLKKRLEPGQAKWTHPGSQQGQCREVVVTELLGNGAAFIDP
ncbi:MAG TPA: hypothetical protein VND64_16410, partial [Pirellulales bacterium]|nr:hypothetical protein [Pirellulales bacterium]